jgi:hypothetical protein
MESWLLPYASKVCTLQPKFRRSATYKGCCEGLLCSVVYVVFVCCCVALQFSMASPMHDGTPASISELVQYV